MFVSNLKAQASVAAKRVSRSIIGIIFLLVAVGLFGAAGLLKLAELYGTLTALLVAGGVFAFIGLVFLMLARTAAYRVPVDPNPVARPLPASASLATYGIPAIVEAFIVGLSAGMANRASANQRAANPPPDH